MRPAILGVTMILLLAVQIGTAQTIVLDTESLVQDGVTEIVIDSGEGNLAADMADWVVTAQYFPNSVVVRDEMVGETDSIGRVSWTPSHAGIVTLSAKRGEDSASRSVSVKFPGLPGGAVVVFFVAGTILLGGAGWSLIRMFEHDTKHGLS
jgi:hypothetical protein